MEMISRGAELELEDGAGAGVIGQLDGERIVEADEGGGDAAVMEEGEEDGAAARGAAADVVAHVEEQDAAGGVLSGGDGVLRGGEKGREAVTPGPHFPGEGGGEGAGEGGVVIGDDKSGGAHFRDIGVGEAEEDAVGEDGGVRGDGTGPGKVVLEGGQRSVLALDVDGEGREGGSLRGAHLTAEGAGHEARGADPGLALIEMGVGAIGEEGVRGADHGGGEVGVWIEGGDEGDAGSDLLADTGEPPAVSIGVAGGDGGAVGGGEHTVEGAGQAEGVEEFRDERLKGVGGDGAEGVGAGGEDGDGFDALGGEALKEAADFVGGGAEFFPDLRAAGDEVLLEVAEGGDTVDEGVRLLEQGDDGDAHGGLEDAEFFEDGGGGHAGADGVADVVFGVDFVPGGLEHGLLDLLGDDDDAVLVGEENVTAADGDAAEFDRLVEGDDALPMEAVIGTDAGGEDGEAHGAHGGDVTDGAVDESAGAAAVAGGGGEQLAPDAGAHGAAGGGDEDLVRLESVHGLELEFVGFGVGEVDVLPEGGAAPAHHFRHSGHGGELEGEALPPEAGGVESVGDDGAVEVLAKDGEGLGQWHGGVMMRWRMKEWKRGREADYCDAGKARRTLRGFWAASLRPWGRRGRAAGCRAW